MPATRSELARTLALTLQSGDRLDREEFERRYEARRDDLKCELIGGIVYVASPVRSDHGEYAGLLAGWLDRYAEATPGAVPLVDVTLRLGPSDEPQPDLALRLERGGSSHIDADGYVAGPPELAVEVAYSSVALDLHVKKERYALHGCAEYLVALVHEEEARWFVHDGRDLVPLAPDPDGLLRSRAFPGLWLDPHALFAGDRARLAAALREGTATAEHAAFVRRLGGPGLTQLET